MANLSFLDRWLGDVKLVNEYNALVGRAELDGYLMGSHVVGVAASRGG